MGDGARFGWRGGTRETLREAVGCRRGDEPDHGESERLRRFAATSTKRRSYVAPTLPSTGSSRRRFTILSDDSCPLWAARGRSWSVTTSGPDRREPDVAPAGA